MSPFWQKWLRVASIVLIIYGALTALAVFPAFTGATKSMIDMVFWPPLEQPGSLGPHGVFLLGIVGAVVMGWGVMIYFLVSEGIASGAPWAYKALWTSLLIWFVVDNIASWIAGAPLNLLGNSVFAALFFAPLIFGREPAAAARKSA